MARYEVINDLGFLHVTRAEFDELKELWEMRKSGIPRIGWEVEDAGEGTFLFCADKSVVFRARVQE